MTLAVQVVAIIFMLTMMFLGIWSFIIANKAYSQIKYKNYLLEKIAHNISLIRNKDMIFDNLYDTDDSLSYSDIKDNTLDEEEEIFSSINEDLSEKDKKNS
ncbi:hypothetical protein [Clostridium sp.]|uniref:hypothetical protein n=1 Tax=Clostridium sp. TaxID=1506 RepID=UPI002639F9B7|nr:hypothetical protein [Clostridium sp.]